MEVLLLGTGSAPGWPEPFCRCDSCQRERAVGRTRATTSALVDGRVLLDLGPDVPLAASRHGADLADVDLVLVTHAHADHFAPFALLAHHWAGAGPLLVVGNQQVVDGAEHWVDPAGPVELRAVTAGVVVEHHGYTARALPAAHGDATSGPGLLWDLTGPDGRRLLYATDTGPVDLGGAHYDLVLLECTFGDRTDHGTDHHDLPAFGRTVATLDADRVLAVHLGHDNPPDLRERLEAVGAELPWDGQRVALGP